MQARAAGGVQQAAVARANPTLELARSKMTSFPCIAYAPIIAKSSSAPEASQHEQNSYGDNDHHHHHHHDHDHQHHRLKARMKRGQDRGNCRQMSHATSQMNLTSRATCCCACKGRGGGRWPRRFWGGRNVLTA